MSYVAAEPEREVCILKREDAQALAWDYRRYGDELPARGDPLKDEIPYSLLSAEHIRDYVRHTGLIAPFYIGGGRRSRLKDAAYEGRIGSVAYQYMPGENRPKIIYTSTDSALRVPKNSIVFVECDLDFRLPEFIALRFNLQIKHVHRGLLLGTGPLVDPGYWGKLCIPLHNLTDEDYFIDKEDGLIWIEFTKTTSSLTPSDKRIGRPPLGVPFWEIRDFLEKATRPIDPACPPIGIHSAIPSVYDEAIAAARAAKADASKAQYNAKKSSRKSEITFWLSVFVGFLTAGGVLVAVTQLTQSYYSDAAEQLREVRPLVTSLEFELRQARADLSAAMQRSETVVGDLDNTSVALEQAQNRIGVLENRVQELSTVIREIRLMGIPSEVAPRPGPLRIAE